MQSVTARELKNRTGEILRRVRAGATVAVTNRGRRVAVISPPAPAGGDETARGSADSDAWAEILASLAATAPEHSDWREAVRRSRGRP